MEFNDGFPNYEVLAQHDNETGIKTRKHLMNVFWILLAVTLIELFVGAKWSSFGLEKIWLILIFVGFTVFKAGYIVMAFMHLGDENKAMRWTILAPYFMFVVYLIFMVTVHEGSYEGKYRDLLSPVKKMHIESEAHE